MERSNVQDILLPYKNEIEELERVLLNLLTSEVPFVKTVAEHIIKNGGKRLRPILTILTAKLGGFTDLPAYKMGSCIEFIHTASLLHDDVVDNAKIRRGKPSANAQWGNHVSVLVGDFLYCRGSQLLTEQGDLKILKVVTDAITKTTEGEVLEITKNLDLNATVEDYLKIIELKTAILMSAACQTGAVLARMSVDFENALADYGACLGMAFQLTDDVLDYTSSEEVFGKTNGIDLKEGKLTLPLIVALKKATEQEKQLIKDALMADRLEKETLQTVKQIIQYYNGFEETYQMALQYVERAKQSLSVFRSSLEKDTLQSIADYVLKRHH